MRAASWIVVIASVVAIIYQLGMPLWGKLSLPALDTGQVAGTTVGELQIKERPEARMASANNECISQLPESQTRQGKKAAASPDAERNTDNRTAANAAKDPARQHACEKLQ